MMHPLILLAHLVGFIGCAIGGWCLYRRHQVRRYRRAKREALVMAEWRARAAELRASVERERRAQAKRQP